MRHVPLSDRLTSCCLVSKRLHAVAATDCLDLQHLTHPRAESALDWILQNGQQLTRLSFTNLRQPLHQLPCPNLLELVVDAAYSWVQQQMATPGVIQGCTKLTRLEVRANILDAEGGVLDGGLSRLVHLQHLVVDPRHGSCSLTGATLPRLQHLTHLTVERLSVENLLQLSTLMKLQQLHLCADDDVAIGPNTVAGLALPGSLTKLKLRQAVNSGGRGAVFGPQQSDGA